MKYWRLQWVIALSSLFTGAIHILQNTFIYGIYIASISNFNLIKGELHKPTEHLFTSLPSHTLMSIMDESSIQHCAKMYDGDPEIFTSDATTDLTLFWLYQW